HDEDPASSVSTPALPRLRGRGPLLDRRDHGERRAGALELQLDAPPDPEGVEPRLEIGDRGDRVAREAEEEVPRLNSRARCGARVVHVVAVDPARGEDDGVELRPEPL